MLEGIRALYAYSAWANARILDTAEQLDSGQFTTDVDRLGSIRETLVHTASAQWTWLERWHGNSPRQLWDLREFPDVASLRARWTLVEDATSGYLATLDEPELVRVVRYINFQGEAWSYPLWQQLLHQANHATQHRSEAAQLLTRFGHSPGGLDFLVFFDEQSLDERR